jgi:flagellar hook-associated protein 1 FlgK
MGTGGISTGVVTDTGPTSNFSGTPPILINGPISIVKTANANEFTISDGVNSATVVLAPNYENVLAQASAVTPAFANYGFDFNLSGVPVNGDIFTVEFNTGGFDDNRNGLKLAALQDAELVRANVVATAATDNLTTFNEAYSNLITDVGIKTSQAKTNQVAFEALSEQSNAWYESLSGVNLDEEAANLIRFQQSYAAAARVITTANTVFDTLLNAAR